MERTPVGQRAGFSGETGKDSGGAKQRQEGSEEKGDYGQETKGKKQKEEKISCNGRSYGRRGSGSSFSGGNRSRLLHIQRETV